MEAILRLADHRASEAAKVCRPNEPACVTIVTTILASSSDGLE